MNQHKRYSFRKVALVVFAVNIAMTLFAVIAILYIPGAKEQAKLKDLCSPLNLIRTGASLVFHTLYFYYGLNAYHTILRAAKPWRTHILFMIVLVLCSLTYYYLSVILVSDDQIEKMKKYGWGLSLFSFFFSSVLLCGLCMLIAYIDNLRIEKKQRQLLERKSLLLENKNTQANYNFLKAQINPHFLHNTLNFFYAKSLPYSQELSDGILTLSEIMRYSLTNTEDVEGKVPLSDEIAHVRNVIKINQMRFSDKLQVNFEVAGIVEPLRIIPFVLITIVENVLKHGELKDASDPAVIKLSVTDKTLSFHCRNKKKTGPKELSTGLGLDNTRKRLALTYGKQFTLDVTDTETHYTTELTILQL
ncbi:sensor histidine kinase [Sediminibacterium ginsengisoli]|uniref:Histidine kinase n=1 Tax=Sediminibacterium ginsengisoli TaxID=413434 RepID=A0A1T4MD30_9BACT|nr:histidine kinase [Sediminibacterium ginsengisoli]SJZ64781.1 Histidine kinase [Sediminibacterium ginsengisoli]